MNSMKLLLLIFLIAYSSVSIAECNIESTQDEIIYLTTDKFREYNLSNRDQFTVAQSLKKLFDCNKTKFADVEIHAPFFEMEWIATMCKEWVRRPGPKRRVFRRKTTCMTHYENYPEINVEQEKYYLESFNLYIYFEENIFIKAVVEGKNA